MGRVVVGCAERELSVSCGGHRTSPHVIYHTAHAGWPFVPRTKRGAQCPRFVVWRTKQLPARVAFATRQYKASATFRATGCIQLRRAYPYLDVDSLLCNAMKGLTRRLTIGSEGHIAFHPAAQSRGSGVARLKQEPLMRSLYLSTALESQNLAPGYFVEHALPARAAMMLAKTCTSTAAAISK